MNAQERLEKAIFFVGKFAEAWNDVIRELEEKGMKDLPIYHYAQGKFEAYHLVWLFLTGEKDGD